MDIPRGAPPPQMDREQLAQMMMQASQSMGQGPSWRPRPTSPFGGLENSDWKHNPLDQEGPPTVPLGPTEADLKLLHLLGRRRMSPELSGVGGVF